MKPNSLSASAVKTFESCPARWLAESHSKTPSSGGSAANLGTAVHDALEKWVKGKFSHDEHARWDQLEALFEDAYYKLFGDDHSRLDEGKEMLEDWYKRNHPLKNEVLIVEVKDNFPLKTSIGDIPFNYIWDRCDLLEDGSIQVIDYKTIMMPVGPDQMREMIQPRAYALAAAIRFKELDPPRIWMSYDMLRHGDPVGVSFTREELKQTYSYLHDVAERVIAEDASNPTEKINPECRWCIRKQVCKTLEKHANAGGVHGITDPMAAADKRAGLWAVSKAIEAQIDELDELIISYAEKEDLLEFETDNTKVSIRARRRRNVDGSMVKRLLPEDVWEEYGKESLSMSAFDKLLKDNRLTSEDKSALKQSVQVKLSNPFVIAEPKTQDSDDE